MAHDDSSIVREKLSYECISADTHIDLPWLPPDLFTSNAAAALKDRMPFVTDSPDGPIWRTKQGAKFGLACAVGSSGRKYFPGFTERVDLMAAEGLYDDVSRASRRLTDPHQRIKDQDRDGVQAEVIYGILLTAKLMGDPEASFEVCRIYNDWLVEFCRPYPGRLIGLAVMAPYADIGAVVEEAERMIRRGIKEIEVAITADMAPLQSPVWEPLWKTLAESEIPAHFHGGLLTAPAPCSTSAKDIAVAGALGLLHSQIPASHNLTSLILSGVLERHPDLIVVFGESGIGWIPYFLDRMDYEWEDQFRDQLDLRMKPSEYWRRQCKATFQYDEVGLQLMNYLGPDSLMWASDFPHPDGVWPDSQVYIEKQFGHLGQTERRQIVCENAKKLYGLG